MSRSLQLNKDQGVEILQTLRDELEHTPEDTELNLAVSIALAVPFLGAPKEQIIGVIYSVLEFFKAAPEGPDFLLALDIQGSKRLREVYQAKVQELKDKYEQNSKQSSSPQSEG